MAGNMLQLSEHGTREKANTLAFSSPTQKPLSNSLTPLPPQLPVLAIKTLQCIKCYKGKERKKGRKKKNNPNKYFPKEAKHSNPLQPSCTLLLL